MTRVARAALWLMLAAPGLWQLWLLVWAIGARFGYPYDLEWMEGGVLHGALRVEEGDGMYPPPSIDFIPFLYTPLYPGLVALLGTAVGVSYQLGRLISIVSLLGIGAVIACQALAVTPRRRDRGPALTGAALTIGLFAAAYPFVEGWYDLVRADTLFLAMITGAIYAITRWAQFGDGVLAHGRIAAVGAVLGLSFFAKQTGIIYVLAVGPIILLYNWRRAPTLVAAAGFVGLGGTALLERSTGGWFWTYVRELHQLHDWNPDRFWRSFDLILRHFEVATVAIAVGLVAVATCVVVRRRLPAPARALLLWTYVYAVSTVVGAIGWGTEFAHYNAFIPAFLHGAIAAGLVVPTLWACGHEILASDAEGPAPRWRPAVASGIAAACALALGGQLLAAGWEPRKLVPTARDRRAGDELIATIRALPGDVWVPSHPWYAYLAGKRPYVHRMGIKDVTSLRLPPESLAAQIAPRYRVDTIAIEPALRAHRFSAIVLDNRDLHLESGMIAAHYRPDDLIPAHARPALYTGARVVPHSIWVPAGPARLPAGARVLFDFESDQFDHWTILGGAWGNGPERKELTGQGLVRRYGGRWFATSMHGGDAATGTMISPPFVIDGDHISMRIGGGDMPKLRAELRIDGKAVRTVSPPNPPSERFSDVEWDVADLRGQTAALALVDDESGPWGHLNVDEVWIRR